MTDLLIVCSPGGHFSEAIKLVKDLKNVNYIFITHDVNSKDVYRNTLVAPHINRDWRLILQIIYAFRIIRKERPKIILSTGSSIAVSFFLVAKFMRIKTIYVESPTRIYNPSLTAKIVKFLASRMYVRHPKLLNKLPHAIYIKGN